MANPTVEIGKKAASFIDVDSMNNFCEILIDKQKLLVAASIANIFQAR
ncbi:MAG TPA: hypothetical protein PK981_09825 [Accumulibacter sp.]|nr:hypothetical protein [Accumulibacter sp.]HMY05589.1 hypothetical protein [Accumulibacter sp.]HNC17849.1 hypothetical protein [Accumulibacter sp.]HNG39330.1 hypothetical protein [Accumulibacter sp.]HNI72440.1 hypothetical protein [Accumulibacter sp.]